MIETWTSTREQGSLSPLVDGEWLAGRLGDASLLIFDCTTSIVPDERTIYRSVPERARFEVGHIPGAQFIDVQADISDSASRWRFMLPARHAFQAAMRRFGLRQDSRVVLYSTGDPWWATRVWWMLRVFGFDGAHVLDGGWDGWLQAGRPVESGPARPRAGGDFRAAHRPELVATRDDVLSAIHDDHGASVVNARLPSQFAGIDGNSYGRAGRIARSVNIPAASLFTSQPRRLLEEQALRERFSQLPAERPVILYCGHGIAASADAFALALIGRRDVRLYDASLSEWAGENDLPMETG